MTLISSPNSDDSSVMGWMCSFEDAGLPVSSPSLVPSSFCSSMLMSWSRKKTTPRWDTMHLVNDSLDHSHPGTY